MCYCLFCHPVYADVTLQLCLSWGTATVEQTCFYGVDLHHIIMMQYGHAAASSN